MVNSCLTWRFFFYLACGFDSLPHAEVTKYPCKGKTESQIPVQRTNVINTWGNSQHSAPGGNTYERDNNNNNHNSFWTSIKSWFNSFFFFLVCRAIWGHRQTKRALTPRTQWQARWHSHGDWWSYSPSEMAYRNLEWTTDKKTFNPVKKSKLSLEFPSYAEARQTVPPLRRRKTLRFTEAFTPLSQRYKKRND